MSDVNDLAKVNARLNILNVLGTRQVQEDNIPPPTSPLGGSSPSVSPVANSPPATDSPSSPPPIPQTGQEITAEHLEEEKLQRAKSLVKALQVEIRGPPPTPPPKSPTIRHPIPRARSP